MNWVIQTFRSSVGKKMLMAITGLSFCLFLLAHLASNLNIYDGRDAFNGYAERLHALGPLLTLAELGLLIFTLIHPVSFSRMIWHKFNLQAVGRSFCRIDGKTL